MNQILGIISNVFQMSKFWDLFKGKERQKLEFQKELAKQIQQNMHAQIAINVEEAKHKSFFVAGWRPFIGWVCGIAICYQYVIRSFIEYTIILLGYDVEFPPELDLGVIMTLVTGMLGIFGTRTYEKLKYPKR